MVKCLSITVPVAFEVGITPSVTASEHLKYGKTEINSY